MSNKDLDFRNQRIKSFYSTTGHTILKEVIEPLLNCSVNYDRLTGYFSIESLISVSHGLQSIYQNGGKMRLVIGIHDVPANLISARALGQLLPQQLVDDYKYKLLNEIGKLSDTASKSSIAAVAWMLRLGLLEVKVASPKNNFGIYHQKRMIFRDKYNNVIAGTGSLNETVGGFHNVEEMQFNFSWVGSEDNTDALTRSFENIWEGKEENIDIITLDDSFASELLKRLANPSNPLTEEVFSEKSESFFGDLLNDVIKSSLFQPYNLSNAVLYPHQERVFSEALSRWPVRVMLADEVGLGKTLEAGVLIAYMIKQKFLKNITILAPAGLLKQWQDELSFHFGLDFYIYDSGNNNFYGPKKSQETGESKIISRDHPFKLVSSQWARLNENKFKIFSQEMLIVDEAHAARVKITQYGMSSTRLWKLLNSVKDDIPHIVLLTATPMQVHPSEYHGLLQILGLPKNWQRYDNYEKTLKIISEKSEILELDLAKTVADLLISSFNKYEWLPSVLTNRDSILIMELRQAYEKNAASAAIVVQNNFAEFKSLMIKFHPGNFLTCRNTKSGLEKFGYKFPKRLFSAPKVIMTGILERYELSVEEYLSKAYGKTEEALNPTKKFPIGFAKSGYYQRLVSSLYASRSSLLKRKNKISLLLDAVENSNSDLIYNLSKDYDIEDEDPSLDLFEDLQISKADLQKIEEIKYNVKTAANSELQYIKELLSILDKLGPEVEDYDPKFIEANNVLVQSVKEGAVLIFSRYTDTLEGFLRLFEKSQLVKSELGYALYTGETAWIKTELGKVEANKSDVADALNSGNIQIVFCSDAASEGLNLQSARILINLDVPWNPARLEQRIGRIARLGQKSPEVKIINLWYPESIESKMYTRLLSRSEEYEIAVGEFPEIFADAIRSEVATKLNHDAPSSRNPFLELREIRKDFQRNALEKIWQNNHSTISSSEVLREDLIQIIKYVETIEGKDLGGNNLISQPGQRNSLSLNNNVLFEAFSSLKNIKVETSEKLIGIYTKKELVALAIKFSKDEIRLIHVRSFGAAMKAACGIGSLTTNDFMGNIFSIEMLKSSLDSYRLSQPNVPNHELAKVPFDGIFLNWQPVLKEDYELREFGNIMVGKN